VLWVRFLPAAPSRCGRGLRSRTVWLINKSAGQPQFFWRPRLPRGRVPREGGVSLINTSPSGYISNLSLDSRCPLCPQAGKCPCGAQVDLFGHHRINCKQWAGRSWRAAHDKVQNALAYELRRLTISAVDNDAQLRHNYSHFTSHKRGGLAVNALPTDLQALSAGNVPRSQFIIDVHIKSMINRQGQWTGAYNPQLSCYTNSTISQKEMVKHTKHAQPYENISFGFVPFVASCLGIFGRSVLRLLMALESLELRQYDAQRAWNGLDPLPDESARSQF
jgi:hypothetical protein